MSKKPKTTSKSKASAKANPDLVPLSQMDNEKKAAKKEKKLSCLDAAAQVLKASGKPMTTVPDVRGRSRIALCVNSMTGPLASPQASLSPSARARCERNVSARRIVRNR